MIIENRRIITFIVDKEENYVLHLADTENLTENGYKRKDFEITPNNISAITNLVTNDKYAFVGFGNKYNDNVILNYIITNRKILETVSQSYLTEHIETTLKDTLSGENKDLEKQYKYASLFNSIDMQRFLFSKDEMVTLEQFVKRSNFRHTGHKHDVENIANILDLNKKRIEARLKVEDIYGEDLFDACEGVVGARLMKSLYLKRNGIKWAEIKDKRNNVSSVKVSEIIFPNISFRTDNCKQMLEEMKNEVIYTDNQSWFRCFALGCSVFNVNLAGLRKNTTPIVVKSDDEGTVYNIDVTSFWPSIMCNYDIKPTQVNNVFLDIYKDMWTRRLGFKKLDKDVSDAMKYMLNGIIGQFMIPESWLYDPVASLKIRINGALLMAMLVERLYDKFDIVCVTIDGMFVKSSKPDMDDELRNIIDEWSAISKLNAEITKYGFVYMLSNNDYVTDDGTCKGFFSYKPNNGSISQPDVIRQAVTEYFVHDVPVVETVTGIKDMDKFVTTISSKSDKFEWEGYVFDNERIYYSSSGSRVSKIVQDKTGFGEPTTTPVTSSAVELVEELPESFPDDINYQYYISEANRIVNKINTTQLKLF